MNKIYLQVIILFWVVTNIGFAQSQASELQTFSTFNKDSLKVSTKMSIKKSATTRWDSVYTDVPLKSPVKVMLKSLVVPGWGQLDNGKKLKAVAFLISEGALLYQIVYNNKRYHKTGDSGYLARRKEYTWLISVTHLYCLLDAVTDAYLYRFDDIMGESSGINLWKEEHTYWAGVNISF